jgi:hypothetical protein
MITGNGLGSLNPPVSSFRVGMRQEEFNGPLAE